MTRVRIVMHRIEGALATRLNEFQASDIPLLASPQGGVAARLRKCCEASTDSADGVVFRWRTHRKTTPAASASVASRNFLDNAATPPCGDARRGISLDCNSEPPIKRFRRPSGHRPPLQWLLSFGLVFACTVA